MTEMAATSWDASRTFWRVRSMLFFLGVIAMNYTWMRPSPVDLIFLSALGVCVLVDQPIRTSFVAFLTIITLWILAYLNASLPYAGDNDVQHELLAKTFVALLAILAAYIASAWQRRDFDTFLKIYLLSTTIAGTIGIVAFAIGHPSLTWDGRAMAFIDDPNMFASFLIPGALAAVYLVKHRKIPWIIGMGCTAILVAAVTVAFSRVASAALLIVLVGYLTFLNRRQLATFLPKIVVLCLVAVLGLTVALALSEDFATKFFERLTLTQAYDTGREGRLGRYLLVLPMILQDPVGVGVLQLERIFPEPIHNIFLSAFVNYGWVGGFSWLALFFGSLVSAWRGYVRTRSDVPIMLLFSVLGIVMCASLHEAEHWRHLWLFLGMAWGFSASSFGACTSSAPQAMTLASRSVAQPGSAFVWGTRGRGFESRRSDH